MICKKFKEQKRKKKRKPKCKNQNEKKLTKNVKNVMITALIISNYLMKKNVNKSL